MKKAEHNTYNIAICDDIPEQIAALRDALSRALQREAYTLATFGSVGELLAAQAAGGNADILLLDIRMPERDGISVAQEINRISPSTQIIFISAYPGYALDAYAAEHIYFLKKPVEEERLAAALTRAIARIASAQSSRIAVPVKGGARHILGVSEIVYFERQNHRTRVFLQNGSLDTPLKLSDIEPLLPQNAFARPHNSYLVNLSCVRSTARTEICMHSGAIVPVSNQKRASFMDALTRSI